MLNYKRCLKRLLKVKVYLAEQITERKVYWCLIKQKLLKLTQRSGFDNRVSVIWDLKTYIYMYIYIYMYVYIRRHRQTHTHIYIYTYLYTHTYTHIYIYIYTYIYIYIYIYIYTYIHTHTHAHTYTHMHTHVKTPCIILKLRRVAELKKVK